MRTVGAGVEAEIGLPAIMVRQIVAAGVHQVAVKNRAAAGTAGDGHRWRRLRHAPLHVLRSDRPQAVSGAGAQIGLGAAPAMAARQQVQAAAHFGRIVQHDHRSGHVGARDAIQVPRA